MTQFFIGVLIGALLSLGIATWAIDRNNKKVIATASRNAIKAVKMEIYETTEKRFEELHLERMDDDSLLVFTELRSNEYQARFRAPKRP